MKESKVITYKEMKPVSHFLVFFLCPAVKQRSGEGTVVLDQTVYNF